MAEALEAAPIAPPGVPVIANVTAAPVTAPTEIRRLLVEQVTAMVRWRESILCMRGHDIDTIIELGAGKVLSGLARRIDRELATRAVESPDDIEAFLKSV
jgi:[acyl-carrier-protein] S-malonyltransferase